MCACFAYVLSDVTVMWLYIVSTTLSLLEQHAHAFTQPMRVTWLSSRVHDGLSTTREMHDKIQVCVACCDMHQHISISTHDITSHHMTSHHNHLHVMSHTRVSVPRFEQDHVAIPTSHDEE